MTVFFPLGYPEWGSKGRAMLTWTAKSRVNTALVFGDLLVRHAKTTNQEEEEAGNIFLSVFFVSFFFFYCWTQKNLFHFQFKKHILQL